MYVSHNTKKICLAYKSKYNSNRENQAVLLMITDGTRWHYLAVTKLCALLKGITSKHKGDFYCFIAHILQDINLKDIKTYVKIMIIAV